MGHAYLLEGCILIDIILLAASTAATQAGSIFNHVDAGTIAAAVVTVILVIGGYHDRKARRAVPEKTCAACIGPLLAEVQGIVVGVKEILVDHKAATVTNKAVDDERKKSLDKSLDAILTEIQALRRDLP